MKKRRYQQLFWDNDGVLVETEHLYYEANRAALADFGIELTTDLFGDISLLQGHSVLDLANDRLTDDQRLSLRRNRDHRYVELLTSQPLLKPCVRETLEQLHGQFRMGIVTSCRREHFDLIHAGTGLLPLFDFVLTREDYPRSKPHPDPYQTALQRTGAATFDCLVIEDTPRGLQAARQAGLDCLVIPNPLLPDGPYSGALSVLQGIDEVVGFLFP